MEIRHGLQFSLNFLLFFGARLFIRKSFSLLETTPRNYTFRSGFEHSSMLAWFVQKSIFRVIRVEHRLFHPANWFLALTASPRIVRRFNIVLLFYTIPFILLIYIFLSNNFFLWNWSGKIFETIKETNKIYNNK